MKTLAAAMCILAPGMLFFSGCSTRTASPSSVERQVRDYNNTWTAVEAVMSRHFLIRHADHKEGRIVSAPVRADGRLANAMTVVKARIIASRDGGYDVEVRAENYIEISEPAALSRGVKDYQWQLAGFDKRLETQLLREIDELRFGGKTASHGNVFLESPHESDELPLPY